MIREATLYDIPRINELGTLLTPNFTTTYKLNDLLNDEYTKILVYEKNDEIKGYLIATCLYTTCDIVSIVTDPEYRKKGVASNLLSYIITECGPELKLVTLEVATKNVEALRLYKNFGFEIIYTRKNYYPDDDAYLMARKSEENE